GSGRTNMKNEEEFLAKYHQAVVLANKDQIEKMKPKIASQWVNEWMAQVGDSITDPEEFRSKFESFLTDDLGFADDSKVSINGDDLVIDVGGCAICAGNDMLRKAGEPTLCPITPTGLMAISRVMGKKATLEGVDKVGKPVGWCQIKYRLAEK
ncbi:MAG TPA: hypothetical protein VIK02_07550, partial [Candidatus Anoxymicrobiaceae bacterium]